MQMVREIERSILNTIDGGLLWLTSEYYISTGEVRVIEDVPPVKRCGGEGIIERTYLHQPTNEKKRRGVEE